MELDQEILYMAHANGDERDPRVIVDSVSYLALEKIKQIVHDDTLSDPACFHRIEEIVCILEQIGSGGGTRHDF